MNELKKENLLGVGFTTASENQILEFITKGLQNEVDKYYIVTPNPELLMLARSNKEYKDILNNARIALPDGIGVILAAKLLGMSLKQRITGVDFMEKLCSYVSKKPVTVGFLGGRPNIAVKTAECLKKKYPGLQVSYTSSEWEDSGNNIKIDILFVAFGSPKQEIWIKNNLNRLPVRIAIGVGGAFNFISGDVSRAPDILRKLGLEWLFRLIIEPWRLKRQLSLIRFLYMVLRERVSLVIKYNH